MDKKRIEQVTEHVQSLWVVPDVRQMIDDLDEQTTTANVGTYEKPLGAGPLRPAPVLGDYEELLKRVRGKAKKR